MECLYENILDLNEKRVYLLHTKCAGGIPTFHKNCTSFDIIRDGKGYYKIFQKTFLTEALYQSHARIHEEEWFLLTISLLNVNDGRKFIKSFKILCFDVFIREKKIYFNINKPEILVHNNK